METDLGSDFKATQYGNEAKIMTVEAVASLAYKLNDQFSFGGGIRYVTGEGKIGATAPFDAAIPVSKTTSIPVSKGDYLKYVEGTDSSWGYVLGRHLANQRHEPYRLCLQV